MIYPTVFIKENSERTNLLFTVAAPQIVGIVPAVFVERILNERYAEQELYLSVSHALLKLQRHLARYEIPLMYVGTVGLQNVGHVGRGGVHHVRYGRAPAQADCACSRRRK